MFAVSHVHSGKLHDEVLEKLLDTGNDDACSAEMETKFQESERAKR